jgi:hypothetical protein
LVHLDGEDEAIEILRLTCLEQGIHVKSGSAMDVPAIDVDG